MVSKLDLVYAHSDGTRRETLLEHTQLTKHYLNIIKKEKNITKILEGIYDYLHVSKDKQKILLEMVDSLIIYHDLGKVNPLFQINRLNIDITYNKNDWRGISGTHHSLLSALIYFDMYFSNQYIKDDDVLKMFCLIHSYVISRHHSSLKDLNDFFIKIEEVGYELYLDCYKGYVKQFYTMKLEENFVKNSLTTYNLNSWYQKGIKAFDENQQLIIYIYTRLLYSLLVSSDYLATNEFYNQFQMVIEKNDINEFYEAYKRSPLYQTIYRHTKTEYHNKKKKSINDLRSELFLEATETLDQNMDKHIFYLNAPTGSGKSNIAYELSLKIASKEHKKVLYVYPYNSLIEQNYESLEQTFDAELLQHIAVYNSITPIKLNKKVESQVYEGSLLDWQFLNYPFLLTSHVNLFHILFSNEREYALRFFQLIDSVVVLDEIQSYNIKKWSKFIQVFDVLGRIYNMKFIIMSATLPPLETLSNHSIDVLHLLSNKDYYYNQKIFKNRVQFCYDLLKNEPMTMEKLIKKVQEKMTGQNILIEFIRKSDAKKFYSTMTSLITEYQIFLLTGEDNFIERRKIINSIKKNQHHIILIGTQVIEAGLDISMDIGFKDTSILDNELQFAGRINRSSKKLGYVYFFNMTNVKSIYKGDYRNNDQFILDDLENIKYMENLDQYYLDICKIIKKKEKKELREFYKNITFLANEKISDDMELIAENNNNYLRVFFNYEINDDDKVYNGEKIWNSYKEILMSDISFSEKKIRLSEIKSYMNYFIYEVDSQKIDSYDEIIGNIYYLQDGEKYIKSGKLCLTDEDNNSIGMIV